MPWKQWSTVPAELACSEPGVHLPGCCKVAPPPTSGWALSIPHSVALTQAQQPHVLQHGGRAVGGSAPLSSDPQVFLHASFGPRCQENEAICVTFQDDSLTLIRINKMQEVAWVAQKASFLWKSFCFLLIWGKLPAEHLVIWIHMKGNTWNVLNQMSPAHSQARSQTPSPRESTKCLLARC